MPIKLQCSNNLQQHQQNVAKLRQFEQQVRQATPGTPVGTTDRALGFNEPAAPVVDPATATPPAPAAVKNAKQKAKAKTQ